MRIVLSFIIAGVLSACASNPTDQSTDSASRDKSVTTGSNIPRKGQAVTVDKAAVENQRNSSGGLTR